MEAVFRSHKDELFSELPEPPPPKSRLTEKIEDPYLTGIENYVSALGTHIRNLQNQEIAQTNNFTQKLAKFKGKTTKKDSEEQARLDFQTGLSNIRRKRKEYREMEREALNERIKYLDSMMQQKQEQEYLRQKLYKLRALPDIQSSADKAKTPLDFFGLILAALQVAFILIMAFCVKYRGDSEGNNGTWDRIDDWYTFYTHIVIMLFFGYGYLSAWIKKFCYGAIAYTFLAGIIAFQWSLLVNGFFWNANQNHSTNWQKYELTMKAMIEATWGATAVVVSLGAVLGKINSLEIIWFSFWEVLVWGITYYLNILVLHASDPGGGITVHLFAACYGLSATLFISKAYKEKQDIRSDKCHELSSSYTSDLISLIGTLFLWVLFPSWNAAISPPGAQHRIAINTWLGLATSCIVGFVVSRVFRKKAFDIRDIQSLTFSGGIAMASGHSTSVEPAVGIIVGGITACVVIVFDVFVVPLLEKRVPLKIYDTRHILSYHGVPGLISAIASIVTAAATNLVRYGTNLETDIYTRGVPRQAGFQTAALAIAVGIGLAGGFVNGILIHYARGSLGGQSAPFTDENHFILPADFPRSPSNVRPDTPQ